MRSKKRVFACVLALMMVFSTAAMLSACGSGDDKEAAKEPANPKLILATPTSTKDSGLLDSILPEFEKESGYKVDVVSVGSGEAMAMGEKGEADVLPLELVAVRARDDAQTARPFPALIPAAADHQPLVHRQRHRSHGGHLLQVVQCSFPPKFHTGA